jgi:hypothetical protein
LGRALAAAHRAVEGAPSNHLACQAFEQLLAGLRKAGLEV